MLKEKKNLFPSIFPHQTSKGYTRQTKCIYVSSLDTSINKRSTMVSLIFKLRMHIQNANEILKLDRFMDISSEFMIVLLDIK